MLKARLAGKSGPRSTVGARLLGRGQGRRAPAQRGCRGLGDDRISKQHQASNFEGANPLAFDNGLTCSSAMCFAGHATLLAGVAV
jgi:hypothetical protein